MAIDSPFATAIGSSSVVATADTEEMSVPKGFQSLLAQYIDIHVTSDEVIEEIAQYYPEITPRNPLVANFLKDVAIAVANVPPLQLPLIERVPTTWASIGEEMDQLWAAKVEGEREIDIGVLPINADVEEHLLVKPFGSFSDPLVVLSSFPPNLESSTVHKNYATVNDQSNNATSVLRTRLGFNKLGIR